MNTKARIQKLESIKPETEFKYKQFRQEVRLNENRFFIDGVAVDESTYAKEYKAYSLTCENSGIPDEIIVHLTPREAVTE
jgi:hypothetical protein